MEGSDRSNEVSNGGGVFVKVQRIISFATLAISILTLVLVLKRPAPLAPAASPAAAAANAQSFQEKVNRLAEPGGPGEGESEVRMNSGEVSAALAEAAGLLPSAASANASTRSPSANPPRASGSMEFPGGVPNIKDYQVSMDGDIVRGQFLMQIAGKDVYLTLAGISARKMVTPPSMPPRSRSAIFPCPHRWRTKCCRKNSPSSAISSSFPTT